MGHWHLRFSVCAFLLVALIGVQMAGSVAAQDATPAASDGATCSGAPVDADHLLSLWYDADHNPIAPAATPADETVTGAEVTLPIGVPADADTVAGVTATVQGVFACFSAGDLPRAFAFFTDDLAASFGPEPGTTYEDAASFLSDPPAPDPNQNTLVSVANVMTLANGQAGAFVIEQDPQGDQIASYGIFEQDGDLWKVDQIIDFPSLDDSND